MSTTMTTPQPVYNYTEPDTDHHSPALTFMSTQEDICIYLEEAIQGKSYNINLVRLESKVHRLAELLNIPELHWAAEEIGNKNYQRALQWIQSCAPEFETHTIKLLKEQP